MADMTLSQALRQVKKIKGDLKERLDRSKAAVTYKAENPPAFAFGQCTEQAETLRQKLVTLQTRVAVTNALTKVEIDGQVVVLAWAVRHLEELKSRISWLKELPVRAQKDTKEEDWDYDDDGKRRRVQVPWKCDLPEAERASQVEKLQADFDRCNDAVEKANHATILAPAW